MECKRHQRRICGYRPLIKTAESKASNQTREENIGWIKPNMLSVTGGKYTTYRSISKRAVDRLQSEVFTNKLLNQSSTHRQPFMGDMGINEWPSETQIEQVVKRFHVDRESLMHIMQTYGGIYKNILNLILSNQSLSVKFDIEHPMILAELQYSISNEWVQSLNDFMFRRTYYGYLYGQNQSLLQSMANAFTSMTNIDKPNGEIVESIQSHGAVQWQR